MYKQQTQQAVSQTSNMLDNLIGMGEYADQKYQAIAITNINVEDCIDDAISAAKAQAAQKNIHISKNIEHYSVAAADHNIIEIALRNIITNAVKYSHANSNITVSSFRNDLHSFILL
jgi:signal transduction histidine kinase